MSITRNVMGWILCLSCMTIAAGIAHAQTSNIWRVEPGDPIESYLNASWDNNESLPAGIDTVLDRRGDLLVVRVAGVEGLEDDSAHVLDLGQRLAWHIRPLHVIASAELSPDGNRIAAVLSEPVAHDLIIYSISDGSSEWVTAVSAAAGSVTWLDDDRISCQPWTEKGAGQSVEVGLSQPGVLSDRGAKEPPTEVYSCGGTNDDYNCGGNNPYPCCSNGGNCTWWAWDRACRGWNRAIAVLSCCGGSGDAWQWLQGASDRGYPTSGTPSVNSIACDSNKSLSSLGHVCWVLEVTSTQVRVSEQNCNGGYGNQERWYNRSSFEGYICNPGGGCGGGGGQCDGSDGAQFVSESWPYDNDTVSPGQNFTKSWTMRNSGSSTWRKSCNHKWAFDGGERFNAAEYTDLGDSDAIGPGSNKTWSLNMTAPSTPGTYQGYWKTDRYGTGRFGDRVWVKVVVQNPAPTVNSHPSNQTPCPGGGANFSISASGSGLSYRWQFNNNDISDGGHYSGTGSSNLSVTNCDGSVTGSYRCRVSNASGSATSNSASLNLQAVTQINSHPSSRTDCAGTSANFSVSASGSGLSYRWQLNGNNLNDGGHYGGTGSSTLNISNLDDSVAGSYRCVVNGSCGSQTSNGGTLTVRPATAVTQHPTALRLCAGSNATFNSAGTGEGAVSYRWHRNGSPLNDGGKISGAFSQALQITSIDGSDAGSYTCVLTAGCGSTTSNAAALDIASPTAVTSDPSAVTVCEGQSPSFQVGAAGEGAISYRWQKDGGDLADGGGISGAATATLQIGQVTSADAGLYRCRVTASCGEVTSQAALLTVNTHAQITQQPETFDGCLDGAVAISLQATGSELSFQWFKEGSPLTDGGHVSGTTTSQLLLSPAEMADTGLYRCTVTGVCGQVTSSEVRLRVVPTVQFETQPRDVQVPAGRLARFTVAASGGLAQFHWYKDGTPLEDNTRYAGTHTPVLILFSGGSEDVGSYHCEVSNPCGSFPSAPATFTLGAGWTGSAGPLYLFAPVDVNGGGGFASGGDYTCWSSAAQNGGVGDIAGGPYSFRDGFWPAVLASIPLFFVLPDFDQDNDVDLDDLLHLTDCLTGEGLGPVAQPCEDADFDIDADVDLIDFALLQLCLSGENIAPDLTCDD